MRLACFAFSVLAGGCLPFAAPPGQVSIAGSPAAPGPQEVTRVVPTRTGGSEDTVVRAGLHPQQLFPDLRGRLVDVGAGYRIGSHDGRTSAHGPYGEVGVYPYVMRSKGAVTRFGVRNVVESLYDTEGLALGWGVGTFLQAEYVGFVSAAGVTGSRGDVGAGAAHGEIGVGLFAGVVRREVDHRATAQLTAGLSGRIPATIGVVCCIKR